MKNIPLSALIGLFFTGLFFLMALFAPFIAPYGMAEVVGDVWEPSSSEFLMGTETSTKKFSSWLGSETPTPGFEGLAPEPPSPGGTTSAPTGPVEYEPLIYEHPILQVYDNFKSRNGSK